MSKEEMQALMSVLAGLVVLLTLVGAVLGCAVAVKTLRARSKATEPVDREEFDRHVAWATQQNHARRDEANAAALKLAVLEKALENGIKRRVEILEGEFKEMGAHVARCVFILEQEFGSKHGRQAEG